MHDGPTRKRLRAVVSQRQEVALQPYDAFLSFIARERAERTHEAYRLILDEFRKKFPDPFGPTADQVDAWVKRPRPKLGGRPAQPNTQRQEAICLRSLAKFLESKGFETDLRVKMPPRPSPKAKSVPRRVVNEIIAQQKKPERLLPLLLMADAGLRAIEVRTITPQALRTIGRRYALRFVRKGGREGIVPASNRLVAAWKQQAPKVEPGTPICRSSTGRLLSPKEARSFRRRDHRSP
jgi:hypothetical protein